MPVLAQIVLLMNEHLNEGRLMLRPLELLEELFLRFGHRATDAVPAASELAHVDAGRGDFALFLLALKTALLARLVKSKFNV